MIDTRVSTRDRLKLELCDRSLAASLAFAGLALILFVFPLVATEDFLLPYRILAGIAVLTNLLRWHNGSRILSQPIPIFLQRFWFHVALVLANSVLLGALLTLSLIDPQNTQESLLIALLVMMGNVAASTSSVGYIPQLQAFFITCILVIPVISMSFVRSSGSTVMKLVPMIMLTFVAYILANSFQFYKSMKLRFDTETALKIEKNNLETVVDDLRKAQKEILQQRARADYAAKMAAVGEMAGGIAHEINSPLATILMTVEMISMEQTKNGNMTPTIKSRLEKIQFTARRIAQIIRSLLLLSRDGSKDQFQIVNLKTAFESTLALCKEKFYLAEVQLQAGPFPDVEIEGREVQISQVFLNLLNNAHDAVIGTSNAWVRVEMQDTDRQIEISIQNSGDPIPLHIREEIFRPFFTTKPVGKGTGLGLSISQGIIEDHGGRLFLDSRAESPRFVIQLPKKVPASS